MGKFPLKSYKQDLGLCGYGVLYPAAGDVYAVREFAPLAVPEGRKIQIEDIQITCLKKGTSTTGNINFYVFSPKTGDTTTMVYNKLIADLVLKAAMAPGQTVTFKHGGTHINNSGVSKLWSLVSSTFKSRAKCILNSGEILALKYDSAAATDGHFLVSVLWSYYTASKDHGTASASATRTGTDVTSELVSPTFSLLYTNTTAIALNTTHRGSNGTDHANVVLNDTHRGSAGTDHSDVALNNTHRTSDGSDHSDVVKLKLGGHLTDGVYFPNIWHEELDGYDGSGNAIVMKEPAADPTDTDDTYLDGDDYGIRYRKGTSSLRLRNLQDTTGDTYRSTYTVSSEDWSGNDYIGFWIYSSETLSSGELKFYINNNSGADEYDIDCPAVTTADVWVFVVLDITGAANRADVDGWGFRVSSATVFTAYINLVTRYADATAIDLEKKPEFEGMDNNTSDWVEDTDFVVGCDEKLFIMLTNKSADTEETFMYGYYA